MNASGEFPGNSAMGSPLAEAESVSEFPENPATDSNKKFKLVCFAESDKFLRNPMWFTDSWSYPSAYDILTYVPGLINQTWRPPGRLKGGVWAPPQ